MIAYLSGNVLVVDKEGVVLLVNGVGYRVGMAVRRVAEFKVGEEKQLYIHTHVREDALLLYGFENAAELKLFETLIGISGIGPKTGLNIFNAGSGEQIIEAIREGKVEFFTAVPGIGKKNALRIVVELKSKLGGDEKIELRDADAELVEGLVGFGFSRREAVEASKGIDRALPDAEKLKLALKNLAPGK